MNQIQFVYITAPRLSVAKKLGRVLVQEKLAACVNILPQMHSIYRWKGRMTAAREVVLIAKTKKSLAKKLIRRIEEVHPYDTPCALSFSITQGSRKYLQWLRRETL